LCVEVTTLVYIFVGDDVAGVDGVDGVDGAHDVDEFCINLFLKILKLFLKKHVIFSRYESIWSCISYNICVRC
jgi:hypothetical protein